MQLKYSPGAMGAARLVPPWHLPSWPRLPAMIDHTDEGCIMNVIESFKDKTAGLVSSIGDINKLFVRKLEDSAKHNISSMSYFANAGIKQLHALTDVHDLASTQKFAIDSVSLSGEMVKKIFEDARQTMNIWSDTGDQLSAIVKRQGAAETKKDPASKSAQASARSMQRDRVASG
jgi:phasin family protein